MKTHDTPQGHCPTCNNPNDCASSFEDASAPREGDYSLCIECGAIGRYLADGTLRTIEDSELSELTTAQRVSMTTAQKAIRERRAIIELYPPRVN